MYIANPFICIVYEYGITFNNSIGRRVKVYDVFAPFVTRQYVSASDRRRWESRVYERFIISCRDRRERTKEIYSHGGI